MECPVDTPSPSVPQPAAQSYAVRLNGTLLKVTRAQAGGASPLDVPLRGIALSDSPVLIRSDVEGERREMVTRLHGLGRRRELPVHVCAVEGDAEPLFEVFLREDLKLGSTNFLAATERIAGTWAMHDVGRWPRERQQVLARVLAVLDEHRLHGRLPHERIPRVIVMESSADAHLEPELEQRLAFFEIALGAAAERTKRSTSRKKS